MNKKALFVASIAIVLPIISVAQNPAVEDFPTLTKRLQTEKPKFAQRQQALLVRDDAATGSVRSNPREPLDAILEAHAICKALQ